jgi:hypothetical protein
MALLKVEEVAAAAQPVILEHFLRIYGNMGASRAVMEVMDQIYICQRFLKEKMSRP